MKYLQDINEILAPQLGGEAVTHATQVLLEESVVRIGTLAGTGIAGAVLNRPSSDIAASFSPGGYLAVSPTRVFALGQTAVKARPGDPVFTLPRQGLTTTAGEKRMVGIIKLTTIALSIGDFQIGFYVPKPSKKDAISVLAELGA